MYSFQMLGQKLNVSKMQASVLSVQHVQGASVWREGDDGFIHPQSDGFIVAPYRFLENMSFLRVRILCEGEIATSIDIPHNVSVCKGDKIELFFIKNTTMNREIFGLLRNLSSGHLYDFLNSTPTIVRTGPFFGGLFSLIGNFFSFIWKSSPQTFVISTPIAAFFFSLFLQNIDGIYQKHIGVNLSRLLNWIFYAQNPEGLVWKFKDLVYDFGEYLAHIRYGYFSNSVWTFIYSISLVLLFALVSMKIHRMKLRKVNEGFHHHIRDAVKIL